MKHLHITRDGFWDGKGIEYKFKFIIGFYVIKDEKKIDCQCHCSSGALSELLKISLTNDKTDNLLYFNIDKTNFQAFKSWLRRDDVILNKNLYYKLVRWIKIGE